MQFENLGTYTSLFSFPFFFEIFLVLPLFAVFPVFPLKLLPLPIIFPDLFKVLLLVLFAVPCIFRHFCWSHSVSNKPALKIKRLGSANMAKIYRYVLREIKVFWTEFLKLSY